MIWENQDVLQAKSFGIVFTVINSVLVFTTFDFFYLWCKQYLHPFRYEKSGEFEIYTNIFCAHNMPLVDFLWCKKMIFDALVPVLTQEVL